MSANGKLKKSELARIYHPDHKLYLQKDAAAKWNTLRFVCKRYLRVDIYPAGPISAYRTYEQQVAAKQQYGSNAATPGTSNHGLGLAVDLATTRMRWAIDRVGSRFGWAKKWSDASWEWWHLKFSAEHQGEKRPDPGISLKYPIASKGSGGKGQKWFVRKIQRRLRAHGHPLPNSKGEFNGLMDKRVKEFQKAKKLKADGVVGEKTWKALKKRPTTDPIAGPEKPSKPSQPSKPTTDTPKPQKPSEAPQSAKKNKAEIIDVSNNNGAISWPAVKASRIEGVYLKLSEGEDWRDTTTDKERIAGIKQSKLAYGFYHFLRPKRRDAAREARFFISQAKSVGGWGSLLPCVDIEVTELGPEETADYLARFISVLRAEGKVDEVLVYASPGWWQSNVPLTNRIAKELKHCKSWVASWGVKTPQHLKGIPGYALHQYTDQGTVGGIKGFVDRNRTPDLNRLLR